MQRRAPVRRALEYREVPGGLRHLLYGLHAGCPGADDGDALALEADRLMRPARGMAGLALETLDSLDPRHCRRGQRAKRGDQETCGMAAAVLQCDGPVARVLLPVRGGDAAAELDVAPQVELVGDVVEVAQGLRLRAKCSDQFHSASSSWEKE